MQTEYNVDDGSKLLQEVPVSATIARMAKTEQVRIPVDLAENARIVAASMGISMPEYVSDVVRAAVSRDLPKAAKIVARKAAEQTGKGGGE